MQIQWIGASTNNFEKGRRDQKITTIVIRRLVGTLDNADIAFQDPNRLASAHYGVRDTVIHQYVRDGDTAFHAETFDKNLVSIGIVLEGGDKPLSDIAYETIARLVYELSQKHRIKLNSVFVQARFAENTPTFDVNRIIMTAQELNPRTILEILKKEKEIEHQKYLEMKKRVDNHDAVDEELRRIIKEKELTIERLSHGITVLTLENQKLTRVPLRQKLKNIFKRKKVL